MEYESCPYCGEVVHLQDEEEDMMRLKQARATDGQRNTNSVSCYSGIFRDKFIKNYDFSVAS